MRVKLTKLTSVLILMPLCSFAQYGFAIKANFDYHYDNQIFKLERKRTALSYRFDVTDSIKGKDGGWIIKGGMTEPSVDAKLILQFNGKVYSKSFVLDSGNTEIYIDSLDVRQKIISFSRPFGESNELFKQISDIRGRYYALAREGTGKLTGPISLTQKELWAAHKEVFAILENKKDLYYSLVSLININRFHEGKDSTILSEFNKLGDALRNTPVGKAFEKEKLNVLRNINALQVGKPVPVFSVGTISGKPFTNTSLKGKPYLIVFSATWCGPCIAEQPYIKKIYAKYRAAGFKVVYFNLDDNHKLWLQHVKARTSEWINVSEGIPIRESIIAKNFTITSIPSVVMVGAEGEIIYKAINENPDFKKIDELLGQKSL